MIFSVLVLLERRTLLNLFRAPSGGYNWIQTEFQETVPMSSYLVGILISDFACQTGTAKPPLSGSVDVDVCVRPNAVNDLVLALEASLKTLEFFEGFYNVAYPLPKLGIQ